MGKGVLLLSGGLDSALSGLLLRQMGVDLVALHLASPFGCDTLAETIAREIGVPLVVRPKGEAFLEILKDPKYGYGRVMNPCIDCRIHMFSIGQAFMEETGASFLVTGEVLGQRPMSQKKASVSTIDRDSGMEGRVLRPLSARLLPPTAPEQDGTVDRSRLFGWAGRSRKPQLALAKKLGLQTVPSPAGGCLLTDDHFRERVGDFVKVDWNGPLPGSPAGPVAAILRYGRHFRMTGGQWVVVGRDQEDNRALEAHIPKAGVAFRPDGFEGPLVCFLAAGTPSPEPLLWEMAFGALHAFGGSKIPAGPLPVVFLSEREPRSLTLPVLPEHRNDLRDRTMWTSQWRQ